MTRLKMIIIDFKDKASIKGVPAKDLTDISLNAKRAKLNIEILIINNLAKVATFNVTTFPAKSL